MCSKCFLRNRFQPQRTTAQTTPRPKPRRPTQRPAKPITRRPISTNQRTTTELSTNQNATISRRPNTALYQCDFESNSKECEVKFSSKNWRFFKSVTDNFYEIILDGGQRSEIFFSQMVPPPLSGVACLTFRYRKFLDSKSCNNIDYSQSQKSLTSPLFRKKRFEINFFVRRNASKVAIFIEKENPCSFFCFSFRATLSFTL